MRAWTPDKVPVPKLKPADVAPAYFLTATDAEKKKFEDSKVDAQWIELGRKLVAVTKGCMNCHTIEKGGKPIPAGEFGGRAEFVLVKQGREKGCLDPVPNEAKSPVYKLDAKEREPRSSRS